MSDDIAEHTKALIEAALATPGALGMAWSKASEAQRQEFAKASKVELLDALADALHADGRGDHAGMQIWGRVQNRAQRRRDVA